MLSSGFCQMPLPQYDLSPPEPKSWHWPASWHWPLWSTHLVVEEQQASVSAPQSPLAELSWQVR
jgi:hypothetical protein